MKKLVVGAAAAALLVTTFQVPSVAATPVATSTTAATGAAAGTVARPASAASAASAAAIADARNARKGKKKRYSVKQGVTFNDPYTQPMTARNKILAALKHVRKGETVRVMSWSFFDTLMTNALIRAYRKGAVVQFFMARALSVDETAGANFRRLKTALRDRTYFKKGSRSWARTCSNSCRGRGGAMHAKWVTISQTGTSKYVVMQGSHNLNIRAAVDQWNDWFTLVGDKKVFDAFDKVFEQAKKDTKAKAVNVRSGDFTFQFAPRKQDPVLDILNDVKCKGADGRAGSNGMTVIRIASAVIYGNRGEAIARRLKDLDNRGCDIKLLYTLAPPPVRNILNGMQYRHLAFDYDGDGLFDDYLHMKAMAISGHIGRNRTAEVVYNGSANWSKFGMISDEQLMTVEGRRRLTSKYIRWIDGIYLKADPPAAARAKRTTARSRGIDPYANVELEMRQHG